jgi:hypothetical protein
VLGSRETYLQRRTEEREVHHYRSWEQAQKKKGRRYMSHMQSNRYPNALLKLIAGIPLKRLEFAPRSSRVGFVVNKATMG